MFPFFEQNGLLGAWEQSPLLSIASTFTDDVAVHVVKQARDETYYAQKGGNQINFCDVIPVVRQRQAETEKRKWKYQDLFSMNDFTTIFSEQGLIHQKDYTVGKKVIRDGEEWFGQLPVESMAVDQANYAIFQKGFSLVFNKMEQRWRPIRDATYQILEEMSCRAVSCNLYLTPPPPPVPATTSQHSNIENGEEHLKTSGFEVHLDWMDVFVVQMIGTKLWSVATTPLIEHATADLKRRPTIQEISSTFAKQTYRDFLLMPGDVLYIPRGFLHNASTVSEEFIQHHMIQAVAEDISGTPSCTKTSRQSAINAGRLAQQGSMHLTFGVEHLCDTTLEAMVHVAVEQYWNDEAHRGGSKETQDDNEDEICDSQLIHLIIAYLSRMYEKCHNAPTVRPHLSFYDEKEATLLAATKEYGVTGVTGVTGSAVAEFSFCTLRQSIPVIRNKNGYHSDSPTIREGCNTNEGDETCSNNTTTANDPLGDIFLKTMDYLARDSSIQLHKTKRFYETNKDGSEMMSLQSASDINFCYPSLVKPIGGSELWSSKSCGLEDALAALSDALLSKTSKKSLEDRLLLHLVKIRSFAIEHLVLIFHKIPYKTGTRNSAVTF